MKLSVHPDLLRQIIRYGIVGAFTFSVDFVLLVILRQFFGWPVLIAAGVSFVASVTINYFISMRYVFTSREELSRRREYITYIVLAAIGLAINQVGMYLGGCFFYMLGIDYEKTLWYMFVKCAVESVVMVWNFVSRRLWLDASSRSDAEFIAKDR